MMVEFVTQPIPNISAKQFASFVEDLMHAGNVERLVYTDPQGHKLQVTRRITDAGTYFQKEFSHG
jgi:hypothetical protein